MFTSSHSFLPDIDSLPEEDSNIGPEEPDATPSPDSTSGYEPSTTVLPAEEPTAEPDSVTPSEEAATDVRQAQSDETTPASDSTDPATKEAPTESTGQPNMLIQRGVRLRFRMYMVSAGRSTPNHTGMN